jgi:acetolactate synthase-1/2/3 large subunit
MGKGAISDRLEQSLLSIGLGFKDYVIEAIESTDLIITVGYDIAEYSPQKWNPGSEKKVVHIDFQPAEVYRHYDPEVEVICDISAAIWELDQRLANVKLKFDTEWYKPIRSKMFEDIRSYELKEDEPFTIPGTLNIIREILDDGGLLISDVGSHKMWVARNFPTFCPNGCIISNGLASMGISLPGAIAASLVDPERQVVSVMGDGGFLMNSQELETARRLGVNFTVVVLNDNDYGLISWKQQMSRGRSVCTKINNPDFKAYVESFGIRGYRPQTLAELKEQLRTAITSKELSVIEVRVDPRVNNELVDKLNAFWRNRS